MDAVSVAIVIILTAMIFYYSSPNKNILNSEGMQSKSRVPKIIWTYWSTENLPDSIKMCIESWKKYNPDYQIIIMNKDNYKNYTNIPDHIANHKNMNDVHQHFADLVRLCAVYDNGGVWLDASILMSCSLNDILPSEFDYEFFGFKREFIPYYYPLISNYMFAAPMGSEFVKRWRDEYCNVVNYNSPFDYSLRTTLKYGLLPVFTPTRLGYFAAYTAVQKIIQYDKYPLGKIILKSSSAYGHRFISSLDHEINKEESVKNACENPDVRYPFIKFHEDTRKYLDVYDNKKCSWV